MSKMAHNRRTSFMKVSLWDITLIKIVLNIHIHFLIFPGMPKPQTNDEDSIAAEDN